MLYDMHGRGVGCRCGWVAIRCLRPSKSCVSEVTLSGGDADAAADVAWRKHGWKGGWAPCTVQPAALPSAQDTSRTWVPRWCPECALLCFAVVRGGLWLHPDPVVAAYGLSGQGFAVLAYEPAYEPSEPPSGRGLSAAFGRHWYGVLPAFK